MFSCEHVYRSNWNAADATVETPTAITTPATAFGLTDVPSADATSDVVPTADEEEEPETEPDDEEVTEPTAAPLTPLAIGYYIFIGVGGVIALIVIYRVFIRRKGTRGRE